MGNVLCVPKVGRTVEAESAAPRKKRNVRHWFRKKILRKRPKAADPPPAPTYDGAEDNQEEEDGDIEIVDMEKAREEDEMRNFAMLMELQEKPYAASQKPMSPAAISTPTTISVRSSRHVVSASYSADVINGVAILSTGGSLFVVRKSASAVVMTPTSLTDACKTASNAVARSQSLTLACASPNPANVHNQLKDLIERINSKCMFDMGAQMRQGLITFVAVTTSSEYTLPSSSVFTKVRTSTLPALPQVNGSTVPALTWRPNSGSTPTSLPRVPSYLLAADKMSGLTLSSPEVQSPSPLLPPLTPDSELKYNVISDVPGAIVDIQSSPEAPNTTTTGSVLLPETDIVAATQAPCLIASQTTNHQTGALQMPISALPAPIQLQSKNASQTGATDALCSVPMSVSTKTEPESAIKHTVEYPNTGTTEASLDDITRLRTPVQPELQVTTPNNLPHSPTAITCTATEPKESATEVMHPDNTLMIHTHSDKTSHIDSTSLTLDSFETSEDSSSDIGETHLEEMKNYAKETIESTVSGLLAKLSQNNIPNQVITNKTKMHVSHKSEEDMRTKSIDIPAQPIRQTSGVPWSFEDTGTVVAFDDNEISEDTDKAKTHHTSCFHPPRSQTAQWSSNDMYENKNNALWLSSSSDESHISAEFTEGNEKHNQDAINPEANSEVKDSNKSTNTTDSTDVNAPKSIDELQRLISIGGHVPTPPSIPKQGTQSQVRRQLRVIEIPKSITSKTGYTRKTIDNQQPVPVVSVATSSQPKEDACFMQPPVPAMPIGRQTPQLLKNTSSLKDNESLQREVTGQPRPSQAHTKRIDSFDQRLNDPLVRRSTELPSFSVPYSFEEKETPKCIANVSNFTPSLGDLRVCKTRPPSQIGNLQDLPSYQSSSIKNTSMELLDRIGKTGQTPPMADPLTKLLPARDNRANSPNYYSSAKLTKESFRDSQDGKMQAYSPIGTWQQTQPSSYSPGPSRIDNFRRDGGLALSSDTLTKHVHLDSRSPPPRVRSDTAPIKASLFESNGQPAKITTQPVKSSQATCRPKMTFPPIDNKFQLGQSEQKGNDQAADNVCPKRPHSKPSLVTQARDQQIPGNSRTTSSPRLSSDPNSISNLLNLLSNISNVGHAKIPRISFSQDKRLLSKRSTEDQPGIISKGLLQTKPPNSKVTKPAVFHKQDPRYISPKDSKDSRATTQEDMHAAMQKPGARSMDNMEKLEKTLNGSSEQMYSKTRYTDKATTSKEVDRPHRYANKFAYDTTPNRSRQNLYPTGQRRGETVTDNLVKTEQTVNNAKETLYSKTRNKKTDPASKEVVKSYEYAKSFNLKTTPDPTRPGDLYDTGQRAETKAIDNMVKPEKTPNSSREQMYFQAENTTKGTTQKEVVGSYRHVNKPSHETAQDKRKQGNVHPTGQKVRDISSDKLRKPEEGVAALYHKTGYTTKATTSKEIASSHEYVNKSELEYLARSLDHTNKTLEIKPKISRYKDFKNPNTRPTPKKNKVSEFQMPKKPKAPPPAPLALKKPKPHMNNIPLIAKVGTTDTIHWKQVEGKGPQAQQHWCTKAPLFDVSFPPLGKRLLQRTGSIEKIQQNYVMPQVKQIEILKLEWGKFPGMRMPLGKRDQYNSMITAERELITESKSDDSLNDISWESDTSTSSEL